MSAYPEASPDLPPPDAAIILMRVGIEAFLATMPRKRGERFLRHMAETLAAEANLSEVFSIRPSSQHADARRAHAAAAALFERLMPVFLARLPPE